MPEVNNFDQVPGFVKPVVNSHWRVENRANILAPRTRHAQMRKSSEDLHVTQQRVAEARSSVRLVQANELEDLEKIFPCAGRDNNFVHPLPGATPLKLSSEIRKGNTLTRIQLSQALIHSRKCCRIRVVDDLGYRMIKLQLSHTSTMLAAARAEPHSLPTGTEVSVSAVSLSITLRLPYNRNTDARPANNPRYQPSPWFVLALVRPEQRQQDASSGAEATERVGPYDMLGNVWQPKGPTSGQYRALRGGSWYNVTQRTRASGRGWLRPVSRDSYDGFRCVGE